MLRMINHSITLNKIFCGLLILFWLGGCKDPVKVPPPSRLNSDFKRNPPQVEKTTLKRLEEQTEEGNTLFVVKFAREAGLPDSVAILLEQGEIILHDDGRGVDEQAGDGNFSTVANIPEEEIVASQQHLDSLRQRFPTVPVFEQRRLVRQLDLPRFDLDRFRLRFPVDFFPAGISGVVDPERTLVITAPPVVDDPPRTFNPCTNVGTPMGRWTFGHLMREMANEPETGIHPSVFVRRWLNRWKFNQTVNDDAVPARINIQNQIIVPWERASGVGPGGMLDLAKAPFRLLAIVNRVDLRDNFIYGGGNAGEARFVFCALDANCRPLPFTVIFEYGIKKRNCLELRAWAQQWLNLQNHPLGSPAYNAALQAITDQFVSAGADPAKLPNKSALNQLRTNEIALAGPWELREFKLFNDDSDAGHLRQVTVKQTPDFDFDRQPVIADYVNANTADIILSRHQVPLEFPSGQPFLGGAAPTPGGFFWDGPPVPPGPAITSREARHIFSLNTCNGCHAGETNTGFTHISPAPFGSSAPLSGFLTGIDVIDPADGTPSRHFDDLQRRAQDLDNLVHSPCFSIIFHLPLRMVH